MKKTQPCIKSAGLCFLSDKPSRKSGIKTAKTTEEDAIDELVARACEDMLTNSNSIRKMLNKMTVKEQKRFLAKIEETFANLIEWINNLLGQ